MAYSHIITRALTQFLLMGQVLGQERLTEEAVYQAHDAEPLSTTIWKPRQALQWLFTPRHQSRTVNKHIPARSLPRQPFFPQHSSGLTHETVPTTFRVRLPISINIQDYRHSHLQTPAPTEMPTDQPQLNNSLLKFFSGGGDSKMWQVDFYSYWQPSSYPVKG